ncbi:SPOR domain-containing protein [Aminivibrio sp.]|uniref:SPOR domain-containing protein n=1 Tax=Aminivibrio sp. TaxID=1872489 RepID=UPI001A560161|nr:SPOR domain-containing protein [Aminivibrio sp.]MBL3538911.1 SPOR domain-containing protein [Aminivibrio sp.]
MSTRESRRLKEKRSMIPFGDIMLPVIGLVAVGLLIVGVKLFFLSGPKTPGYSPVAPTVPAAARQETPQQPSSRGKAATPSRPPATDNQAVLAAPVGSSRPVVFVPEGAGTKSSPVAAPPSAQPAPKAPPASSSKPSAKQPAVQSPAPSAAKSRWGVQIGSFTAREGAETVRQQAAKAGFSSVITAALVNGKTYFRVTVPAGNDRKAADNLADKLTKAGFPVFVVGMR